MRQSWCLVTSPPLLCTPKTNPKPWPNWDADGATVLGRGHKEEGDNGGNLTTGRAGGQAALRAFIPERPPPSECRGPAVTCEVPAAPRGWGPCAVARVPQVQGPVLCWHPLTSSLAPHTPALGPTASHAPALWQLPRSPRHLGDAVGISFLFLFFF